MTNLLHTLSHLSKRKILLALIFFIPSFIYSQDLIVLRNGEQIDCKITKIDSVAVYYDFQKGERIISSFVDKSEMRSYKINLANGNQNDTTGVILSEQSNIVVIDTSKYVKETSDWNNLITYSQRYGIHAKGWSVQYYGYNLRSTSKWVIPIIFGFENYKIHSDYFSQFDYQSASLAYILTGISPFYRFSDSFYLNLGVNLLFGNEKLVDFYYRESSKFIFGIYPSQGIYLITNSSIGFTLGISVFEMLLSSEIYRNDIGVKLELGIKF